MSFNRNYSFDLIRAIAILFVICIHSMGWLNEYDGSGGITLFARSVYYSIIYSGVPLFVMLSGALLLLYSSYCCSNNLFCELFPLHQANRLKLTKKVFRKVYEFNLLNNQIVIKYDTYSV